MLPHQWGSHGEVLSHPHKRLINCTVSMRVVLPQHLSHYSCTFPVSHIHTLNYTGSSVFKTTTNLVKMADHSSWTICMRLLCWIPVRFAWQKPQIMHCEENAPMDRL